MRPDAKVKFGRVDLEVTAFGFGTAPIGNIFREVVVAHPAVTSFIAGTRTIVQLEQNLAWLSHRRRAPFGGARRRPQLG